MESNSSNVLGSNLLDFLLPPPCLEKDPGVLIMVVCYHGAEEEHTVAFLSSHWILVP